MKIPIAKQERMGFPTSLVDLCFVARTHVDMRRSTSSELVVVLLMRRGKQRKKDFKNAGLGLEDQSFCGDGIFPGTWNSLLNCKQLSSTCRSSMEQWYSNGPDLRCTGKLVLGCLRQGYCTTWSKNNWILGTRKTNLKQPYLRGYSKEKYMYFKLPVHIFFCRHCVAKPQNKDHAPANGEGCWRNTSIEALKAGRYHEDVIANPKWKQRLKDAKTNENGIIEKPIM